jgi:hypothetical protein
MIGKWVAKTILIYLLIYCINSFFGGYVLVPSGHSRSLYGAPTVFSMPDEAVWQPYLGGGHEYLDYERRIRFKGDILGYLFYPLLLFDQNNVHLSRRLIDDQGNNRLTKTELSLLQKHPRIKE